MKTLKVIFCALAITLMAMGCEPENTQGNQTNSSLRSLQRAAVRMEIKDKGKPTKANIVGDSASVKRLARWGYQVNFIFSDRYSADPSVVGTATSRWIRGLNKPGDLCWRDTVNCVYLFSFKAVYDYGTYEAVLEDNKFIYYGIAGTEQPEWLLYADNPVFIGFYDTVRHRYKDPFADFMAPDDPNDPFTLDWEYDARMDTLGYIPQSLMEANYPRLQQLFKEGRYSEMEELMRTGYTIYTCTGEEYRELARQGLN